METDVLDIDKKSGGYESLALLIKQLGPLPTTLTCNTGGGGRHFYFRNDGPLKSRIGIAPGIDFKADLGYVIAPPSNHKSGNSYVWASPIDQPLAELPSAWKKFLSSGHGPSGDKVPWQESARSKTVEGERRKTLISIAGGMLRANMDLLVTREFAHFWNQKFCDPPLDRTEVDAAVKGIANAELLRRSRGR